MLQAEIKMEMKFTNRLTIKNIYELSEIYVNILCKESPTEGENVLYIRKTWCINYGTILYSHNIVWVNY